MLSDEQQKAFDLGVTRGAEMYKKSVLEMLYAQLDTDGDPESECAACKITRNYIDAIEGNGENNNAE